MDKETILKLAKDAGLFTHKEVQPELEAFANLVAAHEREALLDLVDNYAKNNTDLKAAIRARST
jgi:hypothetical protein